MTEKMGMEVIFKLEVKSKSNSRCIFFLLKTMYFIENLLDISIMSYIYYALRD